MRDKVRKRLRNKGFTKHNPKHRKSDDLALIQFHADLVEQIREERKRKDK